MRGTKRMIKSLATQEFGHDFAYRRKRGFDVPLAAFFRQAQVTERMNDEWLPGIRERGLLHAKAVSRLWDSLSQSDPGAVSAAESLWVAVGLEVWAKQVLS
jgi:hypothetical protein